MSSAPHTMTSYCRPKWRVWLMHARLSSEGTNSKRAKKERENHNPWKKSQDFCVVVVWVEDVRAVLILPLPCPVSPVLYTRWWPYFYLWQYLCQNKQWSPCSESDAWSHRTRWVTSFHVASPWAVAALQYLAPQRRLTGRRDDRWYSMRQTANINILDLYLYFVSNFNVVE